MIVKVWIGRYESDVLTYKPYCFDYSITYYGSNQNNNFAFSDIVREHAVYNNIFVEFVNEKIIKIRNKTIHKDNSIELYFYSNGIKRNLLDKYPQYKNICKNCNSNKLIDWLNNKTYTRLWLDNTVSVPKYALLSKAECSYEKIHSLFPEFNEYIIQKNYSAGGHGTFKLNKYNEQTILDKITFYEPYLVSPYYKNNISMCCHVIISENDILIFPLALQKLSEANNRLSYEGTDYSFSRELSKDIKSKCMDFINKISILLSQNGYRGICGFDFLIIDKTPFFIEVNPRFMGSSYLINYALCESNLPSLFEFNTMAFVNSKKLGKYKKIISEMRINYITRTISNFSGVQNIKLPQRNNMFFDGLRENTLLKQDVYLYRYFERKQ